MGGGSDKAEQLATEQDAIDQVSTAHTDLAPLPSCPVGGNALAALSPTPQNPVIFGIEVAPVIELDQEKPWLYSVNGPWSAASVDQALYGVDLTKYESVEQADMWADDRDKTRLYVDLLREPYRSQFHTAMMKRVEHDATYFEHWLLDGDDADVVEAYLKFYARIREFRTADGTRSYFDAFLGRLAADTWYTDYLVTESARHPYLDLVYSVGREVEVHKIIGENSEQFGYYRPIALAVDQGTPTATASTAPLDPDYIQRASNMIMDRLVRRTSASESHGIVELLTSLPPGVQAQVLQHYVARYGSNETTLAIFSRSGEPNEVGMLYWLFEDLTDDDRKKLADALKLSGVLKPEAIDALVEGRSWAGRNLPMTTHWGEEAAQYWADDYNQDPSVHAAVLGCFASLWTPNTASATIMTLAGARLFPAIGEASPTLGKILLVGGTGIGAYTTTLAAEGAITGRDPWTGKQLAYEQRIASVLEAISGTLFLAAGFMGAMKIQPKAPPGQRLLGAGLVEQELPPGTSPKELPPGGPRIRARLLRVSDDGDEFVAVLFDEATGASKVVEGNFKAGRIVDPETGDMWSMKPDGSWEFTRGRPRLTAPGDPSDPVSGDPERGSSPQSTALQAPPKQTALARLPATKALAAPRVPVGRAQPLTASNVEWVIEVLRANNTPLTDDDLARIRRAAQNPTEKWGLGPSLRGEIAHILADENLPRTFETIDRVAGIDEDGFAIEITSVKSRQPYGKTYSAPEGFYKSIADDVDTLAAFTHGQLGTRYVIAGPSTVRVLEIEVPPDTLEPQTPGRPQGDVQLRAQFRAEAERAIAYGKTKNIEVRFTAARP